MPTVEDLAKQIEQLSYDDLQRLLALVPRLRPEGVDEEWESLSEESLARTWDNEDYAVYDRWRELYGVQSR